MGVVVNDFQVLPAAPAASATASCRVRCPMPEPLLVARSTGSGELNVLPASR